MSKKTSKTGLEFASKIISWSGFSLWIFGNKWLVRDKSDRKTRADQVKNSFKEYIAKWYDEYIQNPKS